MKYGTYISIILLFNYCARPDNLKKESQQITEKKFQVDSILNSHNFNREVLYDPLSLIYNGKPILRPGQKVENLDSTLSFRYDPNGDFWNKSYLIKDHLSLDEDLSINLKQGSINGILFFSSDQVDNQIFNVTANWTIDTDINEKNSGEIIEIFEKQLFPSLTEKIKFEENWEYEVEKDNYVEYFRMNSPEESPNLYWTIDYYIQMR